MRHVPARLRVRRGRTSCKRTRVLPGSLSWAAMALAPTPGTAWKVNVLRVASSFSSGSCATPLTVVPDSDAPGRCSTPRPRNHLQTFGRRHALCPPAAAKAWRRSRWRTSSASCTTRGARTTAWKDAPSLRRNSRCVLGANWHCSAAVSRRGLKGRIDLSRRCGLAAARSARRDFLQVALSTASTTYVALSPTSVRFSSSSRTRTFSASVGSMCCGVHGVHDVPSCASSMHNERTSASFEFQRSDERLISASIGGTPSYSLFSQLSQRITSLTITATTCTAAETAPCQTPSHS